MWNESGPLSGREWVLNKWGSLLFFLPCWLAPLYQPEGINLGVSGEEELIFYLVFQEWAVWSAQEGRAISSCSPGPSGGEALGWKSEWNSETPNGEALGGQETICGE